jgi:uncharacterized surface protein with fasciclin (FAS1) repeats
MKGFPTSLLIALPIFLLLLVGCQKEVQPAAEQEKTESIGRLLQTSTQERSNNGSNSASMKNNGPSNPLAFARSQARFSVLTVALARTGLMNTLMKLGTDYTLFAPTDEAFAAAGLSVAAVTQLPKEALASILLYHVVEGKIPAAAVPAAAGVATLNGKNIYVRKSSKGVFVNLAQVTIADVKASNGIVHVINKVLMPPTRNIVEIAGSDPRFATLVAAAMKASTGTTDVVALLSGPGAFTVFAPTNDGFSAESVTSLDGFTPDELTNILGYHVIGIPVFSIDLTNDLMPTMFRGGQTTITLTNGPQITGNGNVTNMVKRPSNISTKPGEIDIIATNGIIHVIDRVLLP